MDKRPELILSCAMYDPIPIPEVNRVRFKVDLMDEEVIQSIGSVLSRCNSKVMVDLEIASLVHFERACQMWEVIQNSGSPTTTKISSSNLSVLACARSHAPELLCELIYCGDYPLVEAIRKAVFFGFHSLSLCEKTMNAYNVDNVHAHGLVTNACVTIFYDALRAWNLGVECVSIPQDVLTDLINYTI